MHTDGEASRGGKRDESVPTGRADLATQAVLDRLASRASCRAFDGSSLAPDVLNEIVQDGLEAPSSCNHQNWHFVIVTTSEAKRRACDIAGGNPHFAECSALIYLCFQKGWTHGNFSIVQSVAGACYHMMLSAHLRGLRAIWNAGIGDHEALRRLLGVPPNFELQGALAIGRPRPEAPAVKAPRRPETEVVSWERFSRPAHATYPVKPAAAYPFHEIRNNANPFAEWDPTRWSWAQIADFRGYAVWAKSPLSGVYVSRRQGDAMRLEHGLMPKVSHAHHVVELMPWGGTTTTSLLRRVGAAALTVAELSPHNLTFIRERLRQEGCDLSNVRFAEMEGPVLPLADASVDLVVMTQILEHVPDRHALLHEVKRVLIRGGCLVLSVRNANSAYGSHWRDIEAREQIPNQGPFTPLPAGSVKSLVQEDFTIEEACGIGAEATGDAARLEGAEALQGRLYAMRARLD